MSSPRTAGTNRRLPSRRGVLIVSLPSNDLDLAQAASNAGADALKAHVNITHASGRRFGTLADNRRTLEAMIDVGPPVGLVPGGQEHMLDRSELRSAEEMGIAFCNVDISAAPTYFSRSSLELVPSIGGRTDDWRDPALSYLRELPGTWVEASGVSIDGHGRPLTLQDLLRLRYIGDLTNRKMIIPSVRTLRPDDMGPLFDIPGVWAVMIGAYVVGDTAREVEAATKEFRVALDGVT